jgi:Uma2 family endonuclease
VTAFEFDSIDAKYCLWENFKMSAIATPPIKSNSVEPISQHLVSELITDQWVSATWEEFMQVLDDPQYEDAHFYYNQNQNRQMRIEMMPVVCNQALDHATIVFAVGLYCTLAKIPARGLINCCYIEIGVRAFQPEISYYIGDPAISLPRTKSFMNLDESPIPNLVIEISSSMLSDDLGKKRLLYEKLGVSEYWVVDVQEVKIIAFEMMADGGSRQITASKLLGGFAIADLEEALNLSREKSQSEVGAWLLQKYSHNESE